MIWSLRITWYTDLINFQTKSSLSRTTAARYLTSSEKKSFCKYEYTDCTGDIPSFLFYKQTARYIFHLYSRAFVFLFFILTRFLPTKIFIDASTFFICLRGTLSLALIFFLILHVSDRRPSLLRCSKQFNQICFFSFYTQVFHHVKNKFRVIFMQTYRTVCNKVLL